MSKKVLTTSEVSLLEKGLNFGITEKTINKESLLDDVYKFQRKLKLKEYFSHSEKKSQDVPDEVNSENEKERSSMSGVLKNPYWNPPKITPKSLNVYISAVKNSIVRLIKKSEDTSIKKNLTEDERSALRNLKEQNDVIIQQADKGGKIVTSCGKTSCKTCELISSTTEVTNNETDRSVPVAGGNCLTKDIVYAARCKICSKIYVGQTGEELKSRFNKHRYDAKKRPKNCELAKHVQSHPGHDFDTDIEVSILKIGFKNADERRRSEDKMTCQLGTLIPTGINEAQALGDYAREMYDISQNI